MDAEEEALQSEEEGDEPILCKARALLQLGRPSEAQAAARRGRMLDPEHTVLGELEDEAAAKAADAKLEIVRAGKRVVDAEAREACAPSLR